MKGFVCHAELLYPCSGDNQEALKSFKPGKSVICFSISQSTLAIGAEYIGGQCWGKWEYPLNEGRETSQVENVAMVQEPADEGLSQGNTEAA